ncbi:hypothetical protein RFI_33514, partial [Reticulomyxa filosa]
DDDDDDGDDDGDGDGEKINANEAKGEGNQVIMERLHCCGLCGAKVDIVAYHHGKISQLNSQIQTLLLDIKVTDTAFVEFINMTSANFFLSVPLRFGIMELTTLSAPRPKNVLWTQIAYDKYYVQISRVFVMLCMALLLLFWTIPSAAIQGLANLRATFARGGINLDNYAPSAFISWLEGFLSVFLLNAWMNL